MSSSRLLRAMTTSIAAVVLSTTVATGSASAVGYSFTLCNYADDFHSQAYFPSTNTYSDIAWTNRCVVTTHGGGVVVGIVIRPDTPQNHAANTPYYTTDRSNDVFHTYGSYYSPSVKAHAHR